MRKLLFVLSIVIIAPAVMMAGSITTEQAKQRAQQFLTERRMAGGAASRQATKELLSSVPSEAVQPYYVFNIGQGQGFVLVSGDDRTPAILGYADSGSFDMARLPANMQAWLQGYADQLQWLQAHEDADVEALSYAPSEPIGPLLTTQWNQNEPFNEQCPLFVNGARSVTGCVATAMGQLLKYLHQTYGSPTGTIMDIDEYDCATVWGQEQVHVHVKAKPMTEFDFDNMLEYYSGSESNEQKEAVAKLMAYCGAAVGMDYRDDINGGSGEQPAAVPNALRTYFGVRTNYAVRESYSYQQWTDIICNELSEGRPVMLGGQSSGGGHTFIVDGYDGYGLFHVNWGWGGLSDGYFVLSVMNPNNNSGIGASTSDDGYSYAQELVYGIGNGTADEVGAQLSFSDFTFSGDVLGFVAYNYTGANNNFDFGIGQIDDEGQISYPVSVKNNVGLRQSQGIVSNYMINYEHLGLTAPGTYKLVGISRVSDSDTWLTQMNPWRNYIEVVVGEDMSVELTIMPLPAVLQAADVSLRGNRLADQEQTLSVTIQNEGEEFYGRLFLFASQNDSNKGKSISWSGVTIESGATTTVEFSFTPTSSGKWYLWVTTDEPGTNVIATHETDISNDPYSHDGKFMISQLTVDEASDDWNIDEQGNRLIYVLSDNENQELTFNPTVKNVSGANLAGSITLNFSLEKLGSDGVWRSMSKSYNISYSLFPANHAVSYSRSMTYQTSGYGTYRLVLKMNGSVQDTHYNIVLAKGLADLWDGQGVKRVVPVLANTFRPDDEATAVDLSRLDLNVVSVSPTANPNTVYMIADEQTTPAALEASNVVKGGKAETIVLKDGFDFYTPVSFTVGHVSYERTFDKAYSPENNGWSTIMLPFAVDSIAADGTPVDWPRSADDELADVYLMEFRSDASETLFFDYAPAFEAYQPYIISLGAAEYVNRPIEFMADDVVVAAGHPAVVAREFHQFYGTLSTTVPSTIYRLNDKGNCFVNTDDAEEQPFRGYFTSSTEAALLFICPIPDAIRPVIHQNEVAKDVFSLSGVRLADDLRRLPAGIYIVGGKVVVKQEK